MLFCKRISIYILITALLFSFGQAVLADGTFYANSDFNGLVTDTQLEGWSLLPTGNGSVGVAGGALSLQANGTTTSQMIRKNVTIPPVYAVEFKLRLDYNATSGRYFIIIYSNDGKRLFLRVTPTEVGLTTAGGTLATVSTASPQNVWYTYEAFVDNGTASVYRRDEAGNRQTLFEDISTQEMAGARIDVGIESGAAAAVSLDSLRIYSGLMTTAGFYYDNVPASAVTPGETLCANANIYCFEGLQAALRNIMLLMAVYDSDGMMLDFSFKGVNVGGISGRTSLSTEVELLPALGDYGGAWAELYLWNGFELNQPIASATILGQPQE